METPRDVISQIQLAFAHRLPLCIGALLGALVPVAAYTVGHTELEAAGWWSIPGAIVVGGCAFSAITVYRWGRRTFDSAWKAAFFVVLTEGVMSFSSVHWLSLVVLGVLVAINAVANGANLAVAHLDARAQAAPSLTIPAALPAPEAAVTAPQATKVTAKRTRTRTKPAASLVRRAKKSLDPAMIN